MVFQGKPRLGKMWNCMMCMIDDSGSRGREYGRIGEGKTHQE